MEGAARAANRRADENTVLAYQALTFYGLAMKGKLQSISEYLRDKPKPKRPQTPDEIFAALQDMKMHGAPLTIKQVN